MKFKRLVDFVRKKHNLGQDFSHTKSPEIKKDIVGLARCQYP